MWEAGLRVWLLWALMPGWALGQPYTPVHKAGYCAFYDECGKNPEVTGSIAALSNVSCLSNQPAVLASEDHLTLLRRVCPNLDQGNGTLTCCSTKQLLALDVSMSMTKALLTRCPACAANFASLHCHNTCSPDQSLFINVTRVFDRGPNQQPAVVAYEAFYQRHFAEDTYESCSRVRIPAAAELAVGTMCGVYGSTLCNAQRWLNFQGDISNGLAPLEITFHLLNPGENPGNGLQPLSDTIMPCNETQGNSSSACSCQDCVASCPAIPRPEPLDATFRLGRLSGGLALVIILCSAFVLLAAFLLYLQLPSLKDKPKGQAPGAHVSSSGHNLLGNLFQAWGTWVALWPWTILVVSVAVVVALAGGLAFLELTTDPVELWSAPNSEARREKAFHDQHFGPFFRTNQVILTAPGRPSYHYNSLLLGPKNFSGVLTVDLLLELLELQERLRHMQVWSPEDGHNVSLKDVCYAPLKPHNTSLADCCINSLLQYFQSNRSNLLLTANQTLTGQTAKVDWRDHFLYCANAPLTFKDGTALALSCMADYGAPVFPFLAVGGYKGKDYSEAEALIMTFSLNNFPSGDRRLAQARLWEEGFLEEMRAFQKQMAGKLEVTFMAEGLLLYQRSLEDEINRTTAQDLPIFAVSYLVIFLYIALALGSYSRGSRMLVDSKATLGLGGVTVVLGAVMAAMGFFSYLGIPSSLVILQVVPFLVLAVGADNIFIFVLEYQRLPRRAGEQREAHIGRALGRVAPSMLLCSLSEAICFFLGALTPMPAVRTFALTSGLAVLLDFLLQMSAFVALFSLDTRRQEASRLDVCCCFRSQESPPVGPSEGLLLRFFRKFYAPFLLHRVTRMVVVLLFFALFAMSLYFMCHISVGLNQELALPQDSYLLDYFLFLNRYFEVGAPVYFVTTGGYNFSSKEGMNAICSSAGCDSYSLTQKIQYATEFPDMSYLAIPASSWVDDFIDWLTPASLWSTSCCRIYSWGSNKDQFCPSTVTSLSCLKTCMELTVGPVRPSAEQFHRFLPWFLSDVPNIKCPKGGLAAYSTSVNMDPEGQILASRFMAYHKPLKNSQDYTEALRASRALAANITEALRKVPGTDPAFEVFPYTITNVFYEQYLTIVPEGLFMLTMCLLPTFVVCYLLLGMDLRSGLLNLFCIIMILVDTVGFMALWGITYNAVSLINLVTAVGISVEFVSHITRSFAVSTKPSRLERAREATVSMGSAVFAGVAMTNLPGILVLGLAKAQLIQIFFFRLNLLITLLGLLHGLVFLPVILSYVGPDVNPALVRQQSAKEEAVSSSKDPSLRDSVLAPENRVSENTYDNLSFEPGAEPCWAQERPEAIKELGSGAGSPA